MVIINWKLRPKGHKLNPYVKYKNDPNIFSLKVNHGGGFSYVYGPKRTRAPRRVYKGRNADWFDDVNADGFSVIEVSGMLKELGYENPNIKILYKKPTSDLDKGLEPLSKDIDVLELLSYVNKFKLIELFIEHLVDKCVIDLDEEDNSVIDGLESSNACLETNECEALENEYAGLEAHEGEALENEYAGLEAHEGEALENDNAGLGTNEGEGIENDNAGLGTQESELDPLFSYPNTNHQKGQSSEHISSPYRNAEGNDDNEESDDTKESEESKDSEDSDFECDIKDRIDDVDVDMEMFKKNTSPIILTPPDYHTQISRPPKKRKKSAAELYDRMMKDGKLSKESKTVTCTKCGQKGHNSRSCKGQRGGQSTRTPMPNQRGDQRGGQSAQHNTPHSAPHVTVSPFTQSNVT
ncbi:transposase, MuDR [Tanacetum coccineum]